MAAAVSVAAGIVLAVLSGDPAATVAVAVALTVGHAVRIPTSTGRRLPLTAGVAAGAALATGASLPILAGAGALGLPAGALIVALRDGRRSLADLVPGEPLAYAGFVVVFAGFEQIPHAQSSEAWLHLGAAFAGALVWMAIDGAAGSFTADASGPLGRRILQRVLAEWQVTATLMASGTIYGITEPAMGWWALPLAAVPYGFSHLALDRAVQTRATYRQTIRALGRIPEAGGLSPRGHAERTADLAVDVGTEIGMGADQRTRVEQAALLHDIGRIVLNDPAVAAGGYSTRDLAQWSAAIVAEVRHLQPVAEIVADHYRPFRNPGEDRDGGLPAASHVVKVASAYDVSVGGGMSPTDALEVLHLGSAYDYDPEVVAALRRVLRRRGTENV
jgi:hypothetical protein